jgi:hypothetical protein
MVGVDMKGDNHQQGIEIEENLTALSRNKQTLEHNGLY